MYFKKRDFETSLQKIRDSETLKSILIKRDFETLEIRLKFLRDPDFLKGHSPLLFNDDNYEIMTMIFYLLNRQD